MAVNTYLLASVAINDHIVGATDPCWKRPDLINIPEILRYQCGVTNEAQIYNNNIGIVVLILPYGQFDSKEEMDRDYRSHGESLYSSVYQKAVFLLNKQFPEYTKEEFDWVMPVVEGSSEIGQDYCCVKEAGKENKEFVSLVDCSMIYSSVMLISDFMHLICDKKSLTRYERWQLAYYQRILQTIESPAIFLTNNEEIGYFNEFYRVWDIADAIKGTLGNANQTIELFSFISNYEKNENGEIFSSFLTFFGIVVGLEAIYNLLTALFPDLSHIFNPIFIAAIVLTIIVYACILIKITSKRVRQNREFRKKTRK